MKLQKDLREFIVLLNSRGVEYLVVGGHAVAPHGYPRYTGYIDFLLNRTEGNASRVIEVLKAFGFHDAEQISRKNKVLSKKSQISRSNKSAQ